MKFRKPAILSEDNLTILRTICGLVVAVFAVFTALSAVSYIFTWKADQSFVLSGGEAAGNIAGNIGAKWAFFLVGKCFGLGAAAVVLFFFRLSAGLIFPSRYSRFARYALVLLSGAVLSSAILAFVDNVVNAGEWLGGGMGGRCGAELVSLCTAGVGEVVTFLLLALMAVIWLIFASASFADWISGKSRRLKEAAEAAAAAEVETTDTLLEEDAVANAGETASEVAEDEGNIMAVAGDGKATETSKVEISELETSESEEESSTEEGLSTEEGSSTDLDINEWEGFGDLSGKELPRIEPRDELDKYQFPSLKLLHDYEDGQHRTTEEEQERNKTMIVETLRQFRVEISRVVAIPGPTVTLYKLYLAPGVKFAQVKNLEENIGMALAAEKGVRVVKLADSAGIEVPSENPSIVPLKALLSDSAFKDSKAELPVAMGYTISRKVKTFDLADAPHLLVAGATKQGKSVGLNVIITSLLYSKHPSELKLVFIDPKMVEFSSYRHLLKHYLAVVPNASCEEDEKNNAIVIDQKKAEEILTSLTIEMDERYKLLRLAGVNNVKSYNEKYKNRYLRPDEGHRYLPYVVTIVDEFADLIMSQGLGADARKSAEKLKSAIIRIAQKGRAAGLHLIIATQRPDASVVSGLIKSNFPTKIAFKVSNGIDSKVIIDGPGAEKLIGKGDMLFCTGVEKERVQCALVDTDEINAITGFIGGQTKYKACYNTPYYLPLPPTEGESVPGEVDMSRLDENFEEAAKMIVINQRGSTSDLQRRLGLGYARAGKVMDQLQAAGIVGPQNGSKPREVLVADLNELQGILDAYLK